jgi:hypothetical protein
MKREEKENVRRYMTQINGKNKEKKDEVST